MFAVTATAKRFAAVGIPCIITAGGQLIVEPVVASAETETETDEFEAMSAEELDSMIVANFVAEAYDPNAMVPALVKVVKKKGPNGAKFSAVRDPKKKVKARQFYQEYMAAKKKLGWEPKPTGKKYPKRAAGIKKAWKNPKTELGQRHAAAQKAAKEHAAAVKAKKKAASKKAASKPVSGGKKAGGAKKTSMKSSPVTKLLSSIRKNKPKV